MTATLSDKSANEKPEPSAEELAAKVGAAGQRAGLVPDRPWWAAGLPEMVGNAWPLTTVQTCSERSCIASHDGSTRVGMTGRV
jgi:hypothetical protein